MAAFEAWLVLLVVNVVGELQRKRTLEASRGFLAAARLSCSSVCLSTSSDASLTRKFQDGGRIPKVVISL